MYRPITICIYKTELIKYVQHKHVLNHYFLLVYLCSSRSKNLLVRRKWVCWSKFCSVFNWLLFSFILDWFCSISNKLFSLIKFCKLISWNSFNFRFGTCSKALPQLLKYCKSSRIFITWFIGRHLLPQPQSRWTSSGSFAILRPSRFAFANETGDGSDWTKNTI